MSWNLSGKAALSLYRSYRIFCLLLWTSTTEQLVYASKEKVDPYYSYTKSAKWFVNALLYKVLKNGDEVKLQRNALSVLEHPTGNEIDDDHDYDNSSTSSDIVDKDNDFCKLYDVMATLFQVYCILFHFSKIQTCAPFELCYFSLSS